MSSLAIAPPPWKCKCTAYVLPFYNSASDGLPTEIIYDPLEANTSTFSSEKKAGKYSGGICYVQIIRYSETPVGSYDELALIPGHFNGVGAQGVRRKDLRITGIWVSSKESLLNGRRNWNIPKHLARFSFTPLDSSSSSPLKIEVFPPTPSATAFFTATIHPVNYTPSFPFSSNWVAYLGISTHILQPPLPKGEPADLVVGTNDWKRSAPVMKSKAARMVWIDMRQPSESNKGGGAGQSEDDALLAKKENEHWWPGMRRWHMGLFMKDAILELGESEILSG